MSQVIERTVRIEVGSWVSVAEAGKQTFTGRVAAIVGNTADVIAVGEAGRVRHMRTYNHDKLAPYAPDMTPGGEHYRLALVVAKLAVDADADELKPVEESALEALFGDIRMFDLWWLITRRHAGEWEAWCRDTMQGDVAEIWAALMAGLNGNVASLRVSRNPYSGDEFVADVENYLQRMAGAMMLAGTTA